jgi:hypothetical protein
VLTSRALTNASFGLVTELGHRIDTCVENWNPHPEPFVWARIAGEVLAEVARGMATLDRVTTSGTHHHPLPTDSSPTPRHPWHIDRPGLWSAFGHAGDLAAKPLDHDDIPGGEP